jgi:hypothetical protein
LRTEPLPSASPPVFQPFTSRDTLLAAAIAYQGMYGNADGSIPVT